ncbi:MAG TPA: hypothetical protein VNZ58_05740 [Thermomicrobiales bacterium]|nr:hypothetical protein [Thermomicrobiales bacterium]
MAHFFTLRVDLDELTDAMYGFVTDPTPKRNEREVIKELDDINPEIVDVLECMVLDGTEERQDVADYANALFGPHGVGPGAREM